MNPKKAKDLIPQTAEELNLPVKTVEDIVNFYYREVWSSLTNASDIKVHLTNLGDFNIKHWVLDKEVKKLENFPKFTSLSGQQKYNAGIKIADKVNIIYNLKHLIEEENQRKNFIYEHKKVVNESKKFNTDLEE